MAALSRLESLKTLRVANLDVAFATAFVTLFGGSLLVGFIKYLGGNDFWIGLSSAIPALAGIVQIPGAVWGRAKPNFKKFIFKGGATWRLLHLPLVFLPLLPLYNSVKLFILTLLIGVATLINNIVSPIYNEWIGLIVPPANRGWYFSQRTLVSTIVGITVGLIGARTLDVTKATGQEPIGFVVVFGLGVFCAGLSLFFFGKMSDVQREHLQKASFSELVDVIRSPFADPNFRQIMVFLAVFCVGQGFAGNLFTAYAIETLKMPFLLIQLMAFVYGIGTILTIRSMGFLADKYGNKPVLLILTAMATLGPAFWLFTSPQNLTASAWILILGHIFPGIAWPGIAMTQMNLYLHTSDEKSRAKYLASALAVQSVVLFVAPLAGSWLMAILRNVNGNAELAYKTIFVITIALRLLPLIPLARVKERGSKGVMETIREISKITPKGLSALRQIRTARGEDDRRRAIKNIGKHRLNIGASELTAALTDPSPRVRREAARALGKLGTKEAALSLIWSIQEFPDLVEEETLEAMARTGDRVVTEHLIQYLKDPSSVLRRAAAKGLGELGDPAAIEPLVAWGAHGEDIDLRRASIQALRRLRAPVPDLYSACVLDRITSIRIAAAEAISELRLPECAPALRQSLHDFPEASSEIAYALGSVGEKADIALILQAAQSAKTITTRRRCLLGAAVIAGVERELYKLLSLSELDRDTNLLHIVRVVERRDPSVRDAIQLYANGSESEAIRTLAAGAGDIVLDMLAEFPVSEGFLLSVLVYVQSPHV